MAREMSGRAVYHSLSRAKRLAADELVHPRQLLVRSPKRYLIEDAAFAQPLIDVCHTVESPAAEAVELSPDLQKWPAQRYFSFCRRFHA
jgi:hypothetical protein